MPGGYRISGQTAWSSGSVHAERIMFMGAVVEEGAAPLLLLFLVPREETEVLDTWFIAGMRGTGSNDIRVEDLFVPEYRTAPFAQVLIGEAPGQHIHANPMYHLPVVPFKLAEVVPVIVGAYRGAVTAFVERIRERQGTISQIKAVEKQAAQMRLGRAIAYADSAETLLDAYLTRLTSQRPERNEVTDRVAMKLNAAQITDLCRTGINDIVRGIGGDGFRDHSAVQRHWRDINTVAVHAYLDIDTATETAGRLALDLPIEDRLV